MRRAANTRRALFRSDVGTRLLRMIQLLANRFLSAVHGPQSLAIRGRKPLATARGDLFDQQIQRVLCGAEAGHGLALVKNGGRQFLARDLLLRPTGIEHGFEWEAE